MFERTVPPFLVKHTAVSTRNLKDPFKQVSIADYPAGVEGRGDHVHFFFQVIALISGSFLLRMRKQEFVLKPGDCILIPAGLPHGWLVPVKTRTVQILLRSDNPEEFPGIHVGNRCMLFRVVPARLSTLAKELLLYDTDRPGRDYLVTSILFRLFGEMLEKEELPIGGTEPRKSHPGIRRARQYILQEPSGKISLARLARVSGLSPSRFSTLFREETGFSPIDFLIHRRMDEAKLLLQTTDTPVYQIVEKLGFESVSNFCRKFKSLFRLSPHRYRTAFNPGQPLHRF